VKPKPTVKYKESEFTREKISLYTKIQEASSLDLVRLSLLTNMISQEQYEDFLDIEKSLEDSYV
jgi:hypothetical protein